MYTYICTYEYMYTYTFFSPADPVTPPPTPGPKPVDDGEVRNTMTIDVKIEERISLTVAQGQYLAIFNLLQQNFPEIQRTVSDLYIPPPQTAVDLKENLYGRNCLDPALPLLSTIRIHILTGIYIHIYIYIYIYVCMYIYIYIYIYKQIYMLCMFCIHTKYL
jgi:hypothetical protein